jgi:hypothetical protein
VFYISKAAFLEVEELIEIFIWRGSLSLLEELKLLSIGIKFQIRSCETNA